MWIKYFTLAFIGLTSGFAVAGGALALIMKLKILPRFAGFTRTASKIFDYEDCVLYGAVAGNLIDLFSIHLPFGNVGLAIYGLLSGVFLGCLAVALAEVLNVIPIVLRRARIKKGVGFLVLSMALGKMIGSLLYFYYDWGK